MTGSSVSFDRIAATYDATRGGVERGAGVARGIVAWLRPGPVVEVGVGTGAVALPLSEAGHPVVGVDLSLPMLRGARQRLGARVAAGDGYALPLRAGAAPNVVTVWVTQLVPDVPAFVAALAALLAPGGRFVVVPAVPGGGDDDIADVVQPMAEALRPPRDSPDHIVAAAGAAGLRVVHRARVGLDDLWHTSPTEQADQIEARSWSIFWDLPDDLWQRHVVPTIAALRAMPDADRPRARRGVFDLVVLERPSAP